MQSGGPGPDEAVPLADADIATKIARAASRGRGTDRTPTLEQLLSAFGEREPTPEARRRAGAALDLAGVDVRPPIMEVPPGERVLLTAPSAGRSRRTGGRALGGLLALGGILAIAAVAATLAGQDNGNRASDDLPPEGTGTTPAAATTPADTTTTDTASTDTSETTATETTATTTTPGATTPAATSAKRKRARAKPAAARVTVKVSATARPTF